MRFNALFHDTFVLCCSCVLKIAFTLTSVVFFFLIIFIQKSRHSGIVYNFINTYTIFTVLQIMLKFVYDISIE